MSAKKDTKLKHTENLAEKKLLSFLNLAQLTTSTGIFSESITEANTIINDWLEQTASDITRLTTIESHTRVRLLLEILFQHFEPYFEKKSVSFIECAVTYLIWHNLFNKRCKVNCLSSDKEEIILRRTVAASSMNNSEKVRAVIQSTVLTITQSQAMMITEDVNTFAIYANCVSQSEDIKEFSSALVINVISLSANHERDICSQASFDMWVKILKEDLKYISSDTIIYKFENGMMSITEDRKFCAAVIDFRQRELQSAEFRVVFEETDSKMNCQLNLCVHLTY